MLLGSSNAVFGFEQLLGSAGLENSKEHELKESFAPVDGTGSKHLGVKCV